MLKTNKTNEEINKLVEENQTLIHFVLRNHYKNLCDEKDENSELFQAGRMGLWKAARSYDETKGAKFSTFAIYCIKQSIALYLRKRNNDNKKQMISLDEGLFDDGVHYRPRGEFIMGDSDVSFVDIEGFKKTLTPTELVYFNYLLNHGYSRKTAREMRFLNPKKPQGISRQALNISLKKLRKKWSDYFV